MQFSSIWPIDKILSGAITPAQSGLESDGDEGVLCIPQSFSVTGTAGGVSTNSWATFFYEPLYMDAQVL